MASFARATKMARGAEAVLQTQWLNDGTGPPWHTHAGPVFVLVTEGTLRYIADDCTTRDYAAGEGFVDPGFGNVHTAVAVGRTHFYALYYLPKGSQTIRDDIVPQPPSC